MFEGEKDKRIMVINLEAQNYKKTLIQQCIALCGSISIVTYAEPKELMFGPGCIQGITQQLAGTMVELLKEMLSFYNNIKVQPKKNTGFTEVSKYNNVTVICAHVSGLALALCHILPGYTGNFDEMNKQKELAYILVQKINELNIELNHGVQKIKKAYKKAS